MALFIISLSLPAAAQRDRVIEKPTPTPTAAPTPTPVQTFGYLQSRILLPLQSSEVRRGHIGVKIVSLDSGRTVFAQNSEKYFMPASNMKVFTVAAALERLSPNFRFVTSVYAPSRPDENGVLRGDLTIYGRGDISISDSFDEGGSNRSLDELVERIYRSGVRRIEGGLVGDESYFTGNAIPNGWEWDDLQWYYGAEVSALSINDNTIGLRIRPGATNGSPCTAQILPENTVFRIINKCTTGGGAKTLAVTKKLDQNVIEITGSLPAGDSGFSGPITVSNPAELFVELLRRKLTEKGIVITGANRVSKDREVSIAAASDKVELARLESTPLSIIAQKTIKPSQNLYTETILRALGEQVASSSNGTSEDKGKAVIREFLKEIGVGTDGIIQWDGSGLSRHNLVTPDAVVQLYSFMAKSRSSIAWNAALAVGGVDGTLRNRFRGNSATGNVRGKTGTIDQVSSLSGYLTTASGEKLVFSIIVNGVNSNGLRVKTIDEIVVALANYNGILE